jgi:hypothetical protein
MLTIPRQTAYTIKEHDRGIPVFAVQRACNKAGISTAEDMIFGPATLKSVKALQAKMKTQADGVVGPATQHAIGKYLCTKEERNLPSLPKGLLWSQVSYESGGYLAAVNWSTPGGVDCGITQRRIYDEQYQDDAAIKRAFDAYYQIGLLADRLVELAGIFLPRPGVKGDHERAYRLAALNHNYPSAADQISRVGINGLSAYWTRSASWVTANNLKFPDGASIRTPLEWAQHYALGSAQHNDPGQAVKGVSW